MLGCYATSGVIVVDGNDALHRLSVSLEVVKGDNFHPYLALDRLGSVLNFHILLLNG